MIDQKFPEPALSKYSPIVYNSIICDAGKSAELVSNPWAFMQIEIKNKIKRGGRYNKFYERAVYYIKLAESFYLGSIATPAPAKYTLLYYYMLNLVKAFLSINRVELETINEHHGLSQAQSNDSRLSIHDTSGNDNVNIFYKFVELLGGSITSFPNRVIDIKSIAKGIPEIHNTYCNLNEGEKSLFLPIKIAFFTDDKKSKLTCFLSYKKRYEHTCKNTLFATINSNNRIEKFCEKNGNVHYKFRYIAKPNNLNSCNISYKKFVKQINTLNISSILTQSGYTYYVADNSLKLHHLCNTMAYFFYLGSAARYKPKLIERLNNKPEFQMITEAISVCPKQFLYHMATMITSKIVLQPYSKL